MSSLDASAPDTRKDCREEPHHRGAPPSDVPERRRRRRVSERIDSGRASGARDVRLFPRVNERLDATLAGPRPVGEQTTRRVADFHPSVPPGAGWSGARSAGGTPSPGCSGGAASARSPCAPGANRAAGGGQGDQRRAGRHATALSGVRLTAHWSAADRRRDDLGASGSTAEPPTLPPRL